MLIPPRPSLQPVLLSYPSYQQGRVKAQTCSKSAYMNSQTSTIVSCQRDRQGGTSMLLVPGEHGRFYRLSWTSQTATVMMVNAFAPLTSPIHSRLKMHKWTSTNPSHDGIEERPDPNNVNRSVLCVPHSSLSLHGAPRGSWPESPATRVSINCLFQQRQLGVVLTRAY